MTSATKIDIQKKKIAFERSTPIYSEVDHPSLGEAWPIDRVSPDVAMQGVRRDYELTKVRRPDGEIIHYLVEVDDRKLFQDLISISNGLFDSAVHRATKKLENEIEEWKKAAGEYFMQGQQAELKRIRALPWWRRLLGGRFFFVRHR